MIDDRLAQVRHAANEIEALTGGVRPEALVVLGSGLGSVVDSMDVVAEFPFGTLPGFASAGVVGHAGRFVFGHVGVLPVMAMVGRLHLYEGHPVDRVVLPVRAAHALGCRVLIATNAAGGIGPHLHVGQAMLISDHINLLGANPLTGPNIDQIGVRFPPMADAYTPRLRELARELASAQEMDLAEGVYAAVPGPNYETAAEIRYLRAIGADAVGMSTVPEVIAARHAGMEVLGLSLIANVAGEMTDAHESVLAAVEAATPAMARLVTGILARL
jgi:inosine/guanosine/xanthosine phosphorylase family protein